MIINCVVIYLLQQPFTCVTGGTTAADVGPTGAEAAEEEAEDTDEEAVEAEANEAEVREARVVATTSPQVL